MDSIFLTPPPPSVNPHQMQHIYKYYSRENLPLVAQEASFDDLGRLSTRLSLANWLLLCKDFGLVPDCIPKIDATSAFHLGNISLGDGAVDIGADRPDHQVLLRFNEMLVCFYAITLSPTFAGLTNVKERVDALGSHMRKAAIGMYTFTMERIDESFVNELDHVEEEALSYQKKMMTRMGGPEVWEDNTTPSLLYANVMAPLAAQAMKESQIIAMEIVDLIVSQAVPGLHILELVPVPIKKTKFEFKNKWEKVEWGEKGKEMVESEALDRLYPYLSSKDMEENRNLSKPKPPKYTRKKKKKFIPGKGAFGFGYVVDIDEEKKRKKKLKKKEGAIRQFGDKVKGGELERERGREAGREK